MKRKTNDSWIPLGRLFKRLETQGSTISRLIFIGYQRQITKDPREVPLSFGSTSRSRVPG
jgi:hypothetical protein